MTPNTSAGLLAILCSQQITNAPSCQSPLMRRNFTYDTCVVRASWTSPNVFQKQRQEFILWTFLEMGH